MEVQIFSRQKLRECTRDGPDLLLLIGQADMVPTMLTVMTLSFRTDRSEQTEQTQIRLLLEEQSDQGLHCLLFYLHLFDEIH